MQLRCIILAVACFLVFSSNAFSQNNTVKSKSHSSSSERTLNAKYRRSLRMTDLRIQRLKAQEERIINRIARLEKEIKDSKKQKAQIRKEIKELIGQSIKQKKEEKDLIKQDQKEQISRKDKEIESLRKMQNEMEKD
ncbi:MAG: hypothetical protein HF314_01625 [Ignavibacteria bacterium]|nr:hypothetical protein [Ignavibacteria bacterium]MCU7501742.1 hypothetical protein [Ignavibacteria bacterium]MCU7516851.1 hypothetical protein [Ignavibacteria bacterium]